MAPALRAREALLDAGIGAILALLAAAYYASFLAEVPYPFPDEGYLEYVAFAINSGLEPYRDIELYSYLPGIFYLVAAILDLSSNSIAAVRLVLVAMTVAAIWLLYAVCRQVAPRAVAILVTLIIALVPGAWDRGYMFVLQMALLFFLLAAVRRGSAWASFGFGASLAIAFALRIDVAATGVVLVGCWLAMTAYEAGASLVPRIRRASAPIMASAAGFVCFAAPYSIFLASHGTLPGQLRHYGRFLTGGLTRVGYADNLDPPALGDLFAAMTRPGLEAWIFYGSFLATFWLALRCLWLWYRTYPGAPSGQLRIDTLIFIWALANIPHYAIDRPDNHHLTMHGYAIFLPIAIACREALTSIRNPGRRLPGSVLGSIALLYGALYVGKHVYTGQGGTIGSAQRTTEIHRLSNGMSFPATPNSSLLPIAEYLIRNTAPGERVAALPYYPTYNFVAGRLMPGRDVYLIPEYTTTRVQRRILRDLESVRIVIYGPDQSIHGKASSRPENFMPEVHAYLMESFRAVLSVQRVLVLERIDAAKAPPQ